MNGSAFLSEKTAWLIQRLWYAGTSPKSPAVYAVLDCARDARILPMILESGCPYKSCLGPSDGRETLSKMPHIVRLDPNRQFTRDLLEAGWGKRWGIFFVVPKPAVIEMVRQSISRFLLLPRQDGGRQWFYFYDPHVLRQFLPERDWFTARKFFGPATEILCEGDDSRIIECFQLTEMGVTRVRQVVSLRPEPAVAPLTLPYFDPQELLV